MITKIMTQGRSGGRVKTDPKIDLDLGPDLGLVLEGVYMGFVGNFEPILDTILDPKSIDFGTGF